MSFVLAAALPAMAAEEQYVKLFEGVSAGALSNNDGGTWDTTYASSLAQTNGTAVAFETTSPIKLTVTADAADTNTIAKVDLEVTLADVGNFMNVLTNGAQVAFCVCTNSFNAWNGERWVALDEVPAGIDDSQTTNLTVEISYQGTNNVACKRAARFTVGDMTLCPRGSEDSWVALRGAGVLATNNLAGVGINGEGIIAKADASVMLGVAEYAGFKFGTIKEAVDTVNSLDGVDNPAVEVIRETDEDITSYLADEKNSVHINTAADVAVTVSPTGAATPSGGETSGESGQYTATVAPSVLAKVDTDNIKITLPASMSETKEVDPKVARVVNKETGAVTFGVRTASSVLEAASPGPEGGKPLTANVEKLHEFLANNASVAYTAKYDDASEAASAIESALEDNGGNGIPKYQSYALGINQDTPVKPVTIANDTDPDAITVEIPSLENVATSKSGDYNTITYVLKKDGVSFGDPVPAGNPISLPLDEGTGSYTVIIDMQ